ncbi:glycosyltransferase family 1 protein [Betaproteobacteria bacterium SCN2]|nr:glycosyltransferase family 1 protein [Betaproteobacteria bacterium SCN2]
MTKGTSYTIEVNPKIPRRLIRLEELANNLWYTWDKPTRTLFARLHPGLWEATGHNPKAFLKRVDEQRLVEAAEDHVFLANYNRVLSAYDTYHNEPLKRDQPAQLKHSDMVAYFCAEFGFHESFPIYSGGLGILAGDHCKAASDMRLPFVGVGLLYRQGYFSQTIDGDGHQVARYHDSDFDDLPVTPAYTDDGHELKVQVEFPGRNVTVKVWVVRAGHVWLALLDADLEENAAEDRDITHQLYGGDREMRIRQEIILGIGGARALAAMGVKPTVWHINEGHAAFLVLERVRQLMKSKQLDFNSALEAVAVDTVFTTHTPVPAGHDHFPGEMMERYFQEYCKQLDIPLARLHELGHTQDGLDFNMTALALHGSRHHNGVSRIHGGVSAEICGEHWPQIDPEENPMDYITNGVHVNTFLAQEWIELFDNRLGYDWRHKLNNAAFWEEHIDRIPDHLFWSVRQTLKAQLFFMLQQRYAIQHTRNHGSQGHLERLLKLANPLDPKTLTIGFARRFATYKRATLLAENLDWLKHIVADEDRPVLFLFAGKAHPADQPGQELIRRINELSRMPELEGKLLLIEGYDMGLARRLVAGVDVWLNNPIYPLEASGTSGMKAAMNGTLNLSVLDGWWGEGWNGQNGWAIKPAPVHFDDARRNAEDSLTLYELLQDQVIPLYYKRNGMGYSEGWVKMAKHSIATLLPRFNSARMVGEYVQKFYLPASEHGRKLRDKQYAPAKTLAAWKSRVRAHWPGVSLRRLDTARKAITFGEGFNLRVAANLGGLAPEDVRVEVLLHRPGSAAGNRTSVVMEGRETLPDGGTLYELEITPEMCGKLDYRIRVYPWNELLDHPFETGLMVWL